MLFVQDSQDLLFITYMTQFHNCANFTKKMPDWFAPTCTTLMTTNTKLTTPGVGCAKLHSSSDVNAESSKSTRSTFEHPEKWSWDILSKNRKCPREEQDKSEPSHGGEVWNCYKYAQFYSQPHCSKYQQRQDNQQTQNEGLCCTDCRVRLGLKGGQWNTRHVKVRHFIVLNT